MHVEPLFLLYHSAATEEQWGYLSVRDALQSHPLRQRTVHGQNPQQGLGSLSLQEVRQVRGLHQVRQGTFRYQINSLMSSDGMLAKKRAVNSHLQPAITDIKQIE